MANKATELPRYVITGDTTETQFVRAHTIIRQEKADKDVCLEVRSTNAGILCGMQDTHALLSKILPRDNSEVWSLSEGCQIQAGEVVLRISAPYASLITYQSPILGILSSHSGWATAARECELASGDTKVVVAGASYVHPAIVANMEYAAVIGGAVAVTSPLGARISNTNPYGAVASELIMMTGNDIGAALVAFDKHMPPEVQRIARVGLLGDDLTDTLNAIEALDNLTGIQISTPPERGGLSPALVNEIHGHLALKGVKDIDIIIGGDLDPAKIEEYKKANSPVNIFLVGRYVANAKPMPFGADIKEVDGKPVARRGLVPGITENTSLERIF